jgi:hypothetical protein
MGGSKNEWYHQKVLLKSIPMNVMSVRFDNLDFLGQFLHPTLGDRSRHQSLKSQEELFATNFLFSVSFFTKEKHFSIFEKCPLNTLNSLKERSQGSKSHSAPSIPKSPYFPYFHE